MCIVIPNNNNNILNNESLYVFEHESIKTALPLFDYLK